MLIRDPVEKNPLRRVFFGFKTATSWISNGI
jgi:hypothetical protein